MKYFLGIICILGFSLTSSGQFKSIGFTAGAGYTAVNIEKAVDYSPLEEWDNFGVFIKANANFQVKDKLIIVGEAGSNRLYYWEYYWNDGYYDGYRYRAEWTSNLGIHLKKYLGSNTFLQIGPGIHIFNGGSGVVPGLVFQLGYDLSITDNISLPLVFRIESIFGNALPTSAMAGAGASYQFAR